MTVGMIGYGRFGRLAASWIAREADVFVYDSAGGIAPQSGDRIFPVSLEVAARQEVVILAVPVSLLKGVLREIRTLVAPGSLIIDVCAVKTQPVQWMKRLLPLTAEILGTHPLFGPDSVENSLEGHRIVLCPVRGKPETWNAAVKLLRSYGLVVEIMEPDAHDRMMAETVFLTQCIGRWVDAAGLGDSDSGTVHYKRLRGIVQVARNDSFELLCDMWQYNRHARRVARRLGDSWNTLVETLAVPHNQRTIRRRRRS
jgi:prephenate dehydrogenase